MENSFKVTEKSVIEGFIKIKYPNEDATLTITEAVDIVHEVVYHQVTNEFEPIREKLIKERNILQLKLMNINKILEE